MSHENSTLLPAVRSFLSAPKQLLIGGEWVDAKDGRTFETVNPSTEEVLVQVAYASDGRRGPRGRGGSHGVRVPVPVVEDDAA